MNVVVAIAYLVVISAALVLLWAISNNLHLIWVQMRRANNARDDLYVEITSALAHLRQDTPKDTPRDTPQWPSEEDGE